MTIYLSKFTVLILIAAIALCLIGTIGAPEIKAIQITWRTTITRHFTIEETLENGVLKVVEIRLDDTWRAGCDSWNAADDNGHNCVIVGKSEIHDFMSAIRLVGVMRP